MSCTPAPTATLYATVSTFVPSTSFSQSDANIQAQLTTVVQQSCLASGTISGSLVGCISSAQVTQVNTVGGGGQAAQVPIVVSVPVAVTQPTQTLFASCTDGGSSSPVSQTPAQSSTINAPLTTSILVQSTPPPSAVIEASSTTLADGSVVQTILTAITTLPPTAVYVPTSLAGPTLQSSASQGPGTNVAPIVGGVLGGFLGLIAIVGSLWWLCRRRRSWDDIFEKEVLQADSDAWAPPVAVQRGRESRRIDLSAEPQPYQYGLVGHVIPPDAADETLRSSRYGSISEQSGIHSRHTSLSATPLLRGARSGSSRPSTAGSILTVQTHPGPSLLSPIGSTEMGSRSLSMVPHSNTTRRQSDGQLTPALLSAWTPNTDELVALEPLNHAEGSASSTERRVLQIVNDGPPSPAGTVVPGARQTSSMSSNVIVHTDGGRALEGSFTEPPPYSR